MYYALLITMIGCAWMLPATAATTDLAFRALDGRTVTLGSLLQQGPVVLVFFKTWCSTSQQSLQKYQKLQALYPKLHVYAVGHNPVPELIAFRKEQKLTLPMLEDPAPFKASRDLGARQTPTLVLIGQDGKKLDIIRGWNRAAVNELSRKIAELTATPYQPLSVAGDGMPDELQG